jgi:hypothetical protein
MRTRLLLVVLLGAAGCGGQELTPTVPSGKGGSSSTPTTGSGGSQGGRPSTGAGGLGERGGAGGIGASGLGGDGIGGIAGSGVGASGFGGDGVGAGGASAGCLAGPAPFLCAGANCTGPAVSAICQYGTWTCPDDQSGVCTLLPCSSSVPSGCACSPISGLVVCPSATGTADAATSGDGSAAACPPDVADGSFLACVSSCSSDVGFAPVCVAGAWTCPQGTFDVRTCGTGYCTGPPPPPECVCNPLDGTLKCQILI